MGEEHTGGGAAVVDSLEGLRAIYRPPATRSLDKEIDHLDEHCRDFIGHSPFVVMATASEHQVDVSPKGGPPGFVAVLDDHRLALADMSGNNRLDSLRNIVAKSDVAMLFFVPGVDETMRVNGSAAITVDPDVLDATSIQGMRPNVAVVVQVRSAFIHCAKALRRGGLWDPAAWPDTAEMASPACMLRDHIGLEMSVEDSQHHLEESYARTTWAMGGEQADVSAQR